MVPATATETRVAAQQTGPGRRVGLEQQCHVFPGLFLGRGRVPSSLQARRIRFFYLVDMFYHSVSFLPPDFSVTQGLVFDDAHR